MKKFNSKLLKKVLSIQSYREDDSDMIDYIKKVLGSLKLDYTEDSFGNIYVTKGKAKVYPCIVSHTDTVISKIKNYKVIQVDDVFMAINSVTYSQHGIGGDDKVGVFMCLQALKDVDNIKAVFFRQEEGGCNGSNFSIKNRQSFYNDCGYIIQCDRYGNSDFITEASGARICSNSFENKCKPLMKQHHYKSASGLSTDVATLVKNGVGLSCVNLSCGYYSHHTNKEIVCITDAEDCYNLVLDMFSTLGENKYEHKYSVPKYTSYTSNSVYSKKSENFSTVTKDVLDGIDVTIPADSEYSFFKRISTMVKESYKLAFKGPVPITIMSPCCKKEDSLFIRPHNNSIFCTECGRLLNENEAKDIYSRIYIKSDDEKFVYSYLEQIWLKKSESRFLDYLKSYIRK